MSPGIGRRDRSYLYWRHTAAWCPACRALVPGRILSEGPLVYLERACPQHGHARGVLAESRDWFLERMRLPARSSRPAGDRLPYRGCPDGCGPCDWHEGAVRRVMLPPETAPGVLRPEMQRRRDGGEAAEPLAPAPGSAAELVLDVGRDTPADAALRQALAADRLRPPRARIWVEAAAGLPLDVLERRVAAALGGARPTPDPECPFCLSHVVHPQVGIDLVLHAPMTAAALDAGRLPSCTVWRPIGAGRLAPACWATVTGRGADEATPS